MPCISMKFQRYSDGAPGELRMTKPAKERFSREKEITCR